MYEPGPWEATIIGDCVYIVAGSKEIAIVCVKPDADHLYKPTKMEANANLLKSAPDLLAACEASTAAYTCAILCTPTGDARNKLTESNLLRMVAIDKAKGNS